MGVSGVTGLTLGKSKTGRGTGDDLERQKVPHNDKSQLTESAMQSMHFLCTPATSVVPTHTRLSILFLSRKGIPWQQNVNQI